MIRTRNNTGVAHENGAVESRSDCSVTAADPHSIHRIPLRPISEAPRYSRTKFGGQCAETNPDRTRQCRSDADDLA
jgi:hypothetical protein